MKNQKAKTKKFVLYLLFVFCFLFFAVSATAQYNLETALPTLPGAPAPTTGDLPGYINYLFIFSLSLVAFLALGQMMLGGLTYILAAGNVAKVEDAKETIRQALIGLGLLLVSYLLLNTINPDLVNLRAPNLTPSQFKGGGGEFGGSGASGIRAPNLAPSQFKGGGGEFGGSGASGSW